MLDYYKLNFLTSPQSHIMTYGYNINDGCYTYAEIKKEFDKVIQTEYTKEEKIVVIKNLILASSVVPLERTEFHTPCGEAILHLAESLEDIDGSVNLKIVYALFLNIFTVEDLPDSIEFECKDRVRVEIEAAWCNRLHALGNKDKQKHLYQLMKAVFDRVNR